MLEHVLYFLAGACSCAFGAWLGWNTFSALCGAIDVAPRDADD